MVRAACVAIGGEAMGGCHAAGESIGEVRRRGARRYACWGAAVMRNYRPSRGASACSVRRAISAAARPTSSLGILARRFSRARVRGRQRAGGRAGGFMSNAAAARRGGHVATCEAWKVKGAGVSRRLRIRRRAAEEQVKRVLTFARRKIKLRGGRVYTC